MRLRILATIAIDPLFEIYTNYSGHQQLHQPAKPHRHKQRPATHHHGLGPCKCIFLLALNRHTHPARGHPFAWSPLGSPHSDKHLTSVLTDGHLDTWFHVQDANDVAVTLKETWPGDSLADLLFSVLLSLVLAEVQELESKLGVACGFSKSPEPTFTKTVDLQQDLQEVLCTDITFADDTAFMGVLPAGLPPEEMWILVHDWAMCIHNIFVKRALIPNNDVGKSSLLLVPAGKKFHSLQESPGGLRTGFVDRAFVVPSQACGTRANIWLLCMFRGVPWMLRSRTRKASMIHPQGCVQEGPARGNVAVLSPQGDASSFNLEFWLSLIRTDRVRALLISPMNTWNEDPCPLQQVRSANIIWGECGLTLAMPDIEKREFRGPVFVAADVGSTCSTVALPLVSSVRDGRIFGPFGPFVVAVARVIVGNQQWVLQRKKIDSCAFGFARRRWRAPVTVLYTNLESM